jgi:uncharacterized membrane protein YhaH (DUF805 family)
MKFAHHLALQLVDPRGRADRRDFLHAAIVLFAFQGACFGVIVLLGAAVNGPWLLPANLAFVYMAYAATSRRLHDMGRSAWWMPMAIAIWLVAGFVVALCLALILGSDALTPGERGFWLVFACLLSVPLAAAIWLHVTPGSDGPNRFGPASDEDDGLHPGDMAPARLVVAE